jgi:hypothetical protein
MKYFLLLCFLTIVSCNDKSNSSDKNTTPPIVESNYKTADDYISDVGIANILEHKLDGYELKAAIVNSFHTSLFYYNEELQLLCIRPEEILCGDNDTMILQINGEDTLSKTGYYFTKDHENGKILKVDFADMTEEKNKNLNLSGSTVAYGFKLKQTDTFHYSITLYGDYVRQKITVTYDPNTGWQSQASDILLEYEGVTANVFAFGKETIIEQLRKLPKADEKCIIRTKLHPSNRHTLKLDLDSDYDDFNTYSVEIGIKQKEIVVNDKSIHIREIQQFIDDNSEPGYTADVRINLTNSSNEQTVRELFDYLVWYISNPKYSIGIK